MSNNIAYFKKHANFQLYIACLTGVIWKNQQMMSNTWKNERNFLYVKQCLSPINVFWRKKYKLQSDCESKFCKKMFLYKYVKVYASASTYVLAL